MAIMNSVEVRGARVSVGSGDDKKDILNGLNMTVASGSIYALIGASGCGKTTLLSCILGMKALDDGTIRVLGREVSYEKVSKVGHIVGYMPQNIELTRELSIRETLNYFGNIFQMKRKALSERRRMLAELLELPPEDAEIMNLSGGQKRRVSLAAALIHNPLILILDEPTVGLDPILREKIWDFLVETTQNTGLSIIITTHYIAEAQQSDYCGMMRDGVLLAEDSPKNILGKYEASNLDDAFLKLCLQRNKSSLALESSGKVVEVIEHRSEENVLQKGEVESFEKRKKFSTQTISALMTKEYDRLKRHKGEIFFILFMPVFQVLSYAFAVGGLPVNLKLGIVNHEVEHYTNCEYHLQNSSSYLNSTNECIFNYASCHFINEIRDQDAVKVYYDSFEEAYRDAKRGDLLGVIEFSQDVSKSFTKMLEAGDKERYYDSSVEISLDKSNMMLTTFMEKRLYDAYDRFNRKMLKNCGIDERVLKLPMSFGEYFYGDVNGDFRKAMFPVLFIQLIMFSSLGFTCFAISQNRLEGVWNRTLLAGVRPVEMLITQVLVCVIATVIALSEIIFSAYFSIGIINKGSALLLFVFGILACLTGSFFGIALSVISDDLKIMSLITFAIIQGTCTLSGCYWPLEAQPTLLRYFSNSLPVTIPALSVRNIMLRGFGLNDATVCNGLVVYAIWMVVSLMFAFVVIKKKRFVLKHD